MSIRNLGSWDPLDLDSDPVYADPDAVSDAQTRYQNIAQNINDAVSKLQQIVDTNSESLAGQYVGALQKNAQTILTDLTKAGVRYTDVADQIKAYQTPLGNGLSDTASALTLAETAVAAQKAAQGLPNPQPSSGQTLTDDQLQQKTSRTNAVNSADDDLSAAKSRLSDAMDALNTAGKRFGDAVNSNNYKDGLTDTWKDKVDAVFAEISKIFGAIGMALAGLALLIPGLDAIVLASVIVGVVTLVANSVLLANGQGSVLDVVMGAVGLGLAGAGGLISQVGKNLATGAKDLAGLSQSAGRPVLGLRPGTFSDDIELELTGQTVPGAIDRGPAGATADFQWTSTSNAATNWEHVADWYNNPLTNAAIGKLGGATPDLGFWASAGKQLTGAASMWQKIGSDPAGFASEFGGVVGGYSGYRGLAGVVGAVGGKISPLWYVWGGATATFGVGVGLGYTGGRLTGEIPSVKK
jgi:hypothetical protein